MTGELPTGKKAQTQPVSRKKKDKDPTLVLAASTIDVSLDSAPKIYKGKEPKADDIEKAREKMKALEKYYMFGHHMTFQIPVVQIHGVPATMCFRKLSSIHVKEIRTS